MPKGSQFEDMARDAARSLQAAQAAGQQLDLLPRAEAAAPQEASTARAPRGEGKINSQLRKWLAAQGYRQPEQVLAEVAGLTSREDVFLYAMARVEQVLAWAEAGATAYKGAPGKATLGQRMDLFKVIYAGAIRAAEAALPYGLAKVTPEDAPQAAVQVLVMPGSQVQTSRPGPDHARDVTPQSRRIAPPPLPHEVQANQPLSKSQDPAPATSDRTE